MDMSILIVKYMKDDNSLEEDLKLMSYEKSKLLDDLSYLKLPIKINTKFLKDSSILLNGQYDNYLKLWFGDHKWRLIFRASEHGYSAHSFHDYCDNKGPTIIIKKSTGSWIFGDYTTQSCGGFCILFSG